MEERGEESLDGSSIKPVSSLRSHFEQMANAKPSGTSAVRAVSPSSVNISVGDIARNVSSQQEPDPPLEDALQTPRGREKEAVDHNGLRAPRTNGHVSPSPTRLSPRPVSTATPLVAIHAPQSPPKNRKLNLALSSPSAFLSTEGPLSASSSAASSPRHFRIPSRPNTPLLDPRKSPNMPPSPPPPRRSGEFRRDSSYKGVPPPINRAEKPKILNKPASLNAELASSLHPGLSPFSSPPGSDDSPEHEQVPPLPGNRPRQMHEPTSSPRSSMSFQQTVDTPPSLHPAANKRPESSVLSRSIISPQVTGDRRPPPPLPTRPQIVVESASARVSMPPPPPRASMDRNRMSAANGLEGSPCLQSPPKRVFSHPTTHMQTPPRSHGRSQTVDRTSDRTPTEFRIAPKAVGTRPGGRTPNDRAPGTASSTEGLTINPGEYPDTTHTNRRPPFFKQGVFEIATKHETRIFDVCGEFVCTTGNMTRVWSLLDGANIMTLPNLENTRMMSIAFKPGTDVNEEGSRIWLGNNIGELFEVDIATQGVVASKTNAHTRREIIRIYRHLNEMWTLDDGGTLHLWAPDSTGAPSLTTPYQTFRVPKGHTFSFVVGDELWIAAGKDVRIFIPTLDGSAQFQVLQRPLHQASAGEVTSGTTIGTHPDRVYLGHVDGKVSIYSKTDYSCLAIVNISVYKISSLVGVGSKLWAGFSTGMIYVYDVNKSPWVVKKEWQAHPSNPLIGMILDKSSFWSLDRVQVVSLGQDNTLRPWDGMLQDDWIEAQMQNHEAEFSKLTPIKTLVMTWNAGASTPYHLRQDENDAVFFRDLIRSSDAPDILVFGFQELVDLEDKKTTAKSFFKSKKKDPRTLEPEHMSHQYRDWRDFLTTCLDDYMPAGEIYHLLHTQSLVGLFTVVFVRSPILGRIRNMAVAEVKRGMGGLHGNKGATVLRFVLDDTSMCFINCHLAAGQSQTKDRNTDITVILDTPLFPAEKDHSVRLDSYVGGGDGTMILDHEICILNGDLNYRIDTMSRDTVVHAVKVNNLAKLLERDQLLASKRKNPWFRLRTFNELPITFAPTYKYDVGTDNYDTSEKKRAPAWCDRLLYRGHGRITQLDYQRHEVRVSDHRPVTGMFEIIIKTISPELREVKWTECQQRFLAMKEKSGDAARRDYLTNVLGYDAQLSQQLMHAKG